MRFIADNMLGRLAKWLRIIGCDVSYFNDISDEDLIEYSCETGRIILTRDTRLIRRRKVKQYFFVNGDDYRDQLAQVVRHFDIDVQNELLKRCIVCNTDLKTVDKNDIRGMVPDYVFETIDVFSICSVCGRIYYPATHRENIIKELKKL